MFIDRAEIYVRGGKGGHGCVSFRRERYIPKGGPDGGDGGQGGNVILRADASMSNLLELAGHHHWIAENGRPGKGKNMTGRSGEDTIVRVPPGTLIYDRDTDRLLKDLDSPDQQVCIAAGGRGGRGNKRFASSTHQIPRECEPGGEPEERWLRLELKLIADVGLVGLPNAGKSTLLSRLSKARPKIADYPFTTLEPYLGIVELPGYRRFVMADLPGLIEGAHEGVGLGHDFLRHIERTRVILHMIDLFPADGDPSPGEAYAIIRKELERYSPDLAAKDELIVGNKIDLFDDASPARELAAEIGQPVLAISGVSGQGLDKLGARLFDMVAKAKSEQTPEPPAEPSAQDPFADVAKPPSIPIPRNRQHE